ncbi:MAG: hypothetical protein KAX49_00295 [Halanaerobiales bacterium]|nr:hypothetical protein [Halanaerobiales bacterium]
MKRIIAFHEMLGGVLGVLLFIFFVPFRSFFLGPVILIINIIMLSLYVLSFCAGFLMWKGKKSGILLSLIIQVFQIPQFIINGYTYLFICGSMLSINIEYFTSHYGFNFNVHLGSLYHINLMSGQTSLLLGINVIALVIFMYLLKQRKALSKHQTFDKQLDIQNENNEFGAEQSS